MEPARVRAAPDGYAFGSTAGTATATATLPGRWEAVDRARPGRNRAACSQDPRAVAVRVRDQAHGGGRDRAGGCGAASTDPVAHDPRPIKRPAAPLRGSSRHGASNIAAAASPRT